MARRQSQLPEVARDGAGVRVYGQLGARQVAELAGLGASSMLATHQRNMQMLSAVNRAMADSARAMAEEQRDMLRDCVGDVAGALGMTIQAGEREARTRLQAEFARRAAQNAVRHMRRSAEIAARSRDQVFDLVGHNITGSFEDLQRALARLDGKTR